MARALSAQTAGPSYQTTDRNVHGEPNGSAVTLGLNEFLTLRERDKRLARLTHDIVLPIAHGLEIGAGDVPIPLPDGSSVAYVDYKPRADDSPLPAAAPHIVWAGGGPLAPLCPRNDYDFAVAAQAAQYVPNLLGWFRGIFDVLRPGGVLNLSLPDRRFMFDVRRKNSTLGELIEAYHLDYARPSLRQLFDHAHLAAAASAEQLWNGEAAIETLPALTGEHALLLAAEDVRKAREADAYIECHCWVFTPLSFLALIEDASRLGLFPFVMSQFAPTEPQGFEFFVCLRRDAESDPARLLRMQLDGIAHLRGITERRQRLARAASRN